MNVVKSPCDNTCKYEEMANGEIVCTGCYRTYDDLDRWFNLDNDSKLLVLEECKKRKIKYGSMEQ